MALEVTVGPPRLSINHGYGVLITELDGQINWPTDKGFYHSDTRVLSAWVIFADGQPWDLLNSGAITHYASRIHLANRALATESGQVPAHTVGLTISRCILGGVHEDLDIVNHGEGPVQFNLEIVIRADFADLFEVKSQKIVRRGRITTTWSARRARLQTAYRNDGFCRDLIVRAVDCDSPPVYANGRISFEVQLEPGGSWHSCLLYEIGDGETIDPAPRACVEHMTESGAGKRLDDWRDASLKAHGANSDFNRFYAQSVEDIASLRLPIEGTSHLEFVPAGGSPWFVALFGRDSLIVSLQTAMVYPDFARGALEVLSRYQATRRDDWRDAEPGKIMHELRRGELAHFKFIPHTPYYGTADATILYLMVLHNAWRSTGDPELLQRFMPAAEKCLHWIDKYGDRDGDGFQEYQTRSSAGYENQGWKDAGEALVNTDGSLVKGPKAVVELQGYVYDAWLRMAQVYEALGKPARARVLKRKARALFERFNEAFWDEDAGFYAFCLDGEKKKVMSIASNPGQLMWLGIVPPERAARMVKRLMAPDMLGGWGIRTLSAKHPAYNPYSYQNGAVWPHDNAMIASGFRRYGFDDEASEVMRQVFEAATYFSQHQLPELYSGLPREAGGFPVQYLGANTPQAWAAGSCFAFLQMMLGFAPDAPGDKLYLDPALPAWLPKLDIHGLIVGQNVFDLTFWRDGDVTRFEVLKGDPHAVEQKSYATATDRWV
ncbi:MAG TPA: glycogen debranching N-terminal domain-containing protein [Caulobacteraceae bacterium]|nr:glycogen debranching N-terminal domain-containing protein [Caulobacteraceae bacterium]